MGAVLGLPHSVKEETERLSNWLKVTQLVGGRARTGGQAFLILLSLCLGSFWPRALGRLSPKGGDPLNPVQLAP